MIARQWVPRSYVTNQLHFGICCCRIRRAYFGRQRMQAMNEICE